MKHTLDIQHASEHPIPVSDATLLRWVHQTLPQKHQTSDLTLRFVDPLEITALNHTYRHQNKATNVLAFPSDLPSEIMSAHPFLGDVIICPAVLLEESLANHVPLIAHWAHIVIHGILHLLGHDHQHENDTALMQSVEITTLAKLGFDNPYAIEDPSLDE
jgi:probable rRNA maturation factor